MSKLAVFLVLTATLCAQPARIPEVSGPIPDTQDSIAHQRQGVEKLGYVVEEYFVSGKANVYEPVAMADAADMNQRSTAKDLGRREFTRTILKSDVPYTTRILVYKPRDPAKFSGNVVVESFHPAGSTLATWNRTSFYFISHGDAYVGVQHPATFAPLKAFDAKRYDRLQMADYTQLWGALAQIGALLKSGSGPLAGYRVQYAFLTGTSYTGVAASVFANYHHNDAKLDNGKNVFDGYLSLVNAMYNRPIDVPVIRINSQSDFNGYDGLKNRRADSDKPGEQYRLYEIPGMPHSAGARPYPGMPEPARVQPVAQLAGARPTYVESNCLSKARAGSVASDFPNGVFYAAAFDNLFEWVRKGTPPPKSAWMETNADGSVKLDEYGNATGGIRSPYLDIPIATYGVGTGGCLLEGYKIPYDPAKKKALHKSGAEYIKKVAVAAKRLREQRLILPAGEREIIEEAKRNAEF